MRHARKLLVPYLTVAVGLAGALGLAAASAARADTVTTLSNLTAFSHMAVDSADGYIFLSGNVSGTGAIAVTTLSGQSVTTLDSGDTPGGLALDGSTLYVALDSPGEIGVIDATTLTQTKTIALPAGDSPINLAMQSGELWVGYYSTSAGGDGLAEIDPSTGTFTSVETGLGATPVIAADPSDSGVLVAESQAWVGVYNTAVTPAALLATSSTGLSLAPGCGGGTPLEVVPGGAEFLVGCIGTKPGVGAISTTKLTEVGSYPSGTYSPVAVAVASNGTIATGSTYPVEVYSPAGTEINVFDAVGGLDGLAFSPDGSTLYAVSGPGNGPFNLYVFDSIEVTRSTVTLTGPSTDTPGTPITLTGKLTFAAGAPPQGAPVTVTRANPDSTTTALSASTTDASGDFSVTDTPPGNGGTYTYTASYAGSAATATSAATAPATSTGVTTTIAQLTTTLNLFPASSGVPVGVPVTLNGSLWYGSATAGSGIPVAVSRTNPNGTTTQITGITTSDGRGDFTVTDSTASALGSYTYTASVPATKTTTSAQAQTTITVMLNQATIALAGPANVQLGEGISVAGRLSLQGITPATGTPITVSRENPNYSTTAITGIKTGANGAFTILDNPPALGIYRYSVSVPTTSTIAGTTTVYPVTVTKAAYSGSIRLSKMGYCLDDRNNSSSNGAVVQIWRCNGLASQQWQVESDGTIRHNGLCLDAKGSGTANGTKVQLWACTGKSNQKWDTRSFRIHYDNPAASGKVLDDTGYGGNGTQQQIWANTGTINQIWVTS